jgi:hypothetical protein
MDSLPKVLVSLPTAHRKSSLRPFKILAKMGRDPADPNSKNITTEVRVPKPAMGVKFTPN